VESVESVGLVLPIEQVPTSVLAELVETVQLYGLAEMARVVVTREEEGPEDQLIIRLQQISLLRGQRVELRGHWAETIQVLRVGLRVAQTEQMEPL
jgi:hypothetical protein